MKTPMYRLGEYKIVEYNDGDLSWESHFGLAAQREGRCYVKGNILFIDSWVNEEAGFLKNEFLISLKKLPKWEKTEFYCSHFELYACETGRRISPKEVRQKHLGRPSLNDKESSFHKEASEPVSYRLNRYEIVCGPDGQVSWKTWSGFNRLKSGNCLMMEDVLFFGPCDEEQTCVKGEFLTHLKSLPLWKKTRFFCRSVDLRYSETGRPLALKKDAGGPTVTPEARKAGRVRNREYDLKASLLTELSGTFSKLHSCKSVISSVASAHILPRLASLGKSALGLLEKWKRKRLIL